MGAIHLSEVRCSGQELSLWKCPHKNITAEDCSHSQDAGVRCNLPYTGAETKVSHSFHPSSGISCPIQSCLVMMQSNGPTAHCPRPLSSGSSPLMPPLASPVSASESPFSHRPPVDSHYPTPKASTALPLRHYRSDSVGAAADMKGESRCK